MNRLSTYRSRKTIKAAKIANIHLYKDDSGDALLKFQDPIVPDIKVDREFMIFHRPKEGMYYQQGSDNKVFCFEARDLEENYELVEEKQGTSFNQAVEFMRQECIVSRRAGNFTGLKITKPIKEGELPQIVEIISKSKTREWQAKDEDILASDWFVVN